MIKITRKMYFLFVIGSALFSGLSVILPDELGFLAWVSLIPLCVVLFSLILRGEAGLKSFYGLGLLWFFIYYSVSFHFFIYMYPLDFTGIGNFLSVIIIAIAWFGLSLLQALISALFFLIIGFLTRLGAFRRLPGVILPIVLSLILCICEWFQTIGWWGVPWARLSLSQSAALPIIATSSLFGSYFITFVICIVNSFIALAFFAGERRRVILSLIALGAFIANLTLGGIIYGVTEAQIQSYSDEEKIRVALIQGNFSSKIQFDTSKEEYIERYEKYTTLACEGGDIDLVVWPETALPFSVNEGSYYMRRVLNLAEDNSVSILFGALRYEDDMLYNAMYCARPDGTLDSTVYTKRHPVPFGEYMPWRGFLEAILPFMSEITMLEYDIHPGEGSEIYEIDGVGSVGCTICFDSIYENLTRETVKDGAELIALGTNDSWFMDSVAIYLHNNQARFRSVETGRYTVRAAVTGISTVISPTGEIIAETKPLEAGYEISEVVPRSEMTLYTLIGNVFIYLAIALVSSLLLYEIIRVKFILPHTKDHSEVSRNEES